MSENSMVPSKTVAPTEIRLAVEWLAANANGVSLLDWEPRSQTLLTAADQIEAMASVGVRQEREIALRKEIEKAMEDCIGVTEGQSFEQRAEELMVTEVQHQQCSAVETTPRRIGPETPDDALVICPHCTSQFQATPVNIQRKMGQLLDENARLQTLVTRSAVEPSERSWPPPPREITLYGQPDNDVGLDQPECYTALNIGGHSAAILVVTKMADGSPVPPYAQEIIDWMLGRQVETTGYSQAYADQMRTALLRLQQELAVEEANPDDCREARLRIVHEALLPPSSAARETTRDPEQQLPARCRCGGFPRPTLMGRTICSVCGADVPQPSPEKARAPHEP